MKPEENPMKPEENPQINENGLSWDAREDQGIKGQYAAEVYRLRAELLSLREKLEACEGRHDVVKRFHDLAVTERNYERRRFDHLTESLREVARKSVEANATVPAEFILSLVGR